MLVLIPSNISYIYCDSNWNKCKQSRYISYVSPSSLIKEGELARPNFCCRWVHLDVKHPWALVWDSRRKDQSAAGEPQARRDTPSLHSSSAVSWLPDLGKLLPSLCLSFLHCKMRICKNTSFMGWGETLEKTKCWWTQSVDDNSRYILNKCSLLWLLA